MKNTIENLVKEALKSLGIEAEEVLVEHPSDLSHGDYSTNAGIKFGHKEELFKYLNEHKPSEIEKIELAGPGFINFHLSKEFFKKSIGEIVERGDGFGKNEKLKGQKIVIEYTDPNPFKEFHIGHLMSNAVGESISRIIECNGAEIKRVCYQGDVGMHVAKAVWGMADFFKGNLLSDGPLEDKKRFLKSSYSVGNAAYDPEDLSGSMIGGPNKSELRKQIEDINKEIYFKTEGKNWDYYKWGREVSLEYFASIYKKLGSQFDLFFFESESAPVGQKIVEENTNKDGKRIFRSSTEKERYPIVFDGEMYDKHLHTRVFINSEGLPTYEAKELGLAKIKYEEYKYDQSIVITGNEVNDYFKVLLCAMKQIFPELAEKTKHLSHGMLRLPTGKMSSRTGDVITAESLIETVKEKVKGDEKVAIGAIKYMILRQSIGNDIIFDIDKSVSTEGDSGVYLQYAYARTCSILEKANSKGDADAERENIHEVEKLLYRFPEIVERASKEYSPNLLTTYLTEIAGSFNNLYASEQIISDTKESAYLIALTRAFNTVMKNGLTILGIPTPERM